MVLPSKNIHVISMRFFSWATLWLFFLFFLVSAVYGGWQGFSDVPYGDMWDDLVGFGAVPRLTGSSAWFGFHNEHRIVFSRILFYIYERCMGGVGGGLVLFNYALAIGLSILLSVFVSRCAYKKESDSRNILAVFGLLCPVLFIWDQNENLTWGYQSQFYFVYLFPLASLLFILRAVDKKGFQSELMFFCGCMTGMFSAFSMANGLLFLPLLCVVFVTLGGSVLRVLAVAVGVFLVFWVYLHGYSTPSMHSGFDLSRNGLGAANYYILYCGSPFYYILKSKLIAKIAGLLLNLGLAFCFYMVVRRGQVSKENIVYFVYLAYVALSGAMVAYGRSWLGEDSSISSRYLTPVLVLWALLIFKLHEAIRFKIHIWDAPRVLMLVFLLLWSPRQMNAFSVDFDSIFNREKAVLALEMGVKDPIVNVLYPYPGVVEKLSDEARKLRVGVFSQKKYSFANAPTHKPYFCRGRLHFNEVLPSRDERFLIVKIVLRTSNSMNGLNYIDLVEDGSVVGRVIRRTGRRRIDLDNGFEGEGFVSAGAHLDSVKAYSDDCIP
jgi:hypothetical protein